MEVRYGCSFIAVMGPKFIVTYTYLKCLPSGSSFFRSKQQHNLSVTNVEPQDFIDLYKESSF